MLEEKEVKNEELGTEGKDEINQHIPVDDASKIDDLTSTNDPVPSVSNTATSESDKAEDPTLVSTDDNTTEDIVAALPVETIDQTTSDIANPVPSTEIKQEIAKEEVAAQVKEETEVAAEVKEETEVVAEVKEETEVVAEVKEETEVVAEVKEETEVVAEVKEETEVTKDENAEAVLKSNSDSKKKDQEDSKEQKEIDYHTYTKEELIEAIESLCKGSSIKDADKVLHEIKPLFDEFVAQERTSALEKYVADGGDKESFEFRHDDEYNRFDASFKLLRDRRSAYYKDTEKSRQENLERKDAILEELRNLLDNEETTVSIEKLKEIQQEWRNVGQVPNAYVRTMWANYHALIDRFYDNRSIYFELKELDRRKNQELKEQLCVKAEVLVNEENLKTATSQLNELHEEYKHIGPVPKVVQEALWQRFKAASDKVYERRKAYVEVLKKDLNTNLEAKLAIIENIKPFIDFNSDRINDWNKKTKELLDLQKQWEAIRGIPKERSKDVNKEFWSAFKGFFHNKNLFFKRLEAERTENLKKKEELIVRADALKSNTDLEKTANDFKKLQADWKEIGPVPQKVREEVYARFKASCDEFFNERRNQSKEAEKEYVVNLEKKRAIVLEIDAMSANKNPDIKALDKLIVDWNEVGFVPKNDIRKVRTEFNKSVENYLGSVEGISETERAKVKITQEFGSLKGKPNSNQKLNGKESAIRKQISKLEDDIGLWNNNLAFFANSKTADKLKEEFGGKIKSAEEQVQVLKDQLKIIRTL